MTFDDVLVSTSVSSEIYMPLTNRIHTTLGLLALGLASGASLSCDDIFAASGTHASLNLV